METTTTVTQTNELSTIDRAILAVQARAVAKSSLSQDTAQTQVLVAVSKRAKNAAPVVSEVVVSDEMPSADELEALAVKEAAKASRLTEREAKAIAFAVERNERKAVREAAKEAKVVASQYVKPAHMKKVEAAGAKLPQLNERVLGVFAELTASNSPLELLELAMHLQHFTRAVSTKNAAKTSVVLERGMRVKIIGGNPKFIGVEGVIDSSRRIRCFVECEASSKPLYLFNSDVELIVADAYETVEREAIVNEQSVDCDTTFDVAVVEADTDK